MSFLSVLFGKYAYRIILQIDKGQLVKHDDERRYQSRIVIDRFFKITYKKIEQFFIFIYKAFVVLEVEINV